jgi:hypothetical protein
MSARKTLKKVQKGNTCQLRDKWLQRLLLLPPLSLTPAVDASLDEAKKAERKENSQVCLSLW